MSTITEKITTAVLARIAPTSTDDLIRHHQVGETIATTGDERLVLAIIADEITRRLDIEDALDDVFEDESFYGTYSEAIAAAIAIKKSN
jgi:hypothetical protein